MREVNGMDEKILAVQRMQDYIAAHYREEITMGTLARVSLYSPWYARRLFEDLTGFSPASYIRKLRLTKSALRLRDENCSVLDAALDAGFGSAEGYLRAFTREFGVHPGTYAKNPVPVYLFTPYGVKSTHHEQEDCRMETRNIFIREVVKPARKVIIKRGIKADEYMSYCEEVGCDVWGLLTSIKSLSGEPVCLWLPEKYREPVTNSYVQGAEVPMDYAGPVPAGFDVITLPEAAYLELRGEPFEEEHFEDAIGEIWKAEEKLNLESMGYRKDDENPKIQLEPIGSRGYIELIPVKKA